MKYCAFLRGVNVKGTNMKMLDVCEIFKNAGMQKVTSVLASGNILFESDKNVEKLKKILEQKMSETFKYGGILFSINDNFGGLYVSKQHVSFEFTYGYKLDTELALEGDGKYRRHLKFRTLDEVNQSKAKIKLLLLQATMKLTMLC